MKKHWHSEKYKKYLLKKSRKEIKKKQKNNKRKGIIVCSTKKTNKNDNRPLKRYTIKAPSIFSLTENIVEMLNMFIRFAKKSKKQKGTIFFDLSDVNKITSDAILYILSLLEWKKGSNSSNSSMIISGNEPNSNKCKKIFIESGFYNHVHTRKKPSQSNEKIFSIKKGALVEPKILGEVMNFSLNHLNTTRSITSSKIYGTIIECMCNTKSHAYDKDSERPFWWLNAEYNENEKIVHFTFLDNGKGIPSTVKKKITQHLLPDEEIIFKAFKDGLMSSSKEMGRGKGLPTIYKYFLGKKIQNLVVISNNGYVDFEKNERRHLNNSFQGTLLTWDFIELK